VQGLRGDDVTYMKVSAGCKSFDAYSGPDGDNVRFSFDAKVILLTVPLLLARFLN
jgi:hypothetical protein